MQNLLEDITIIDFSHRLPGPLAGLILANLGAKVIKIEDKKFGDPFNQGVFAEFDPSFKHWYKNLNHNKEILTLDFSSEESKNSITSLVKKADAIIMGLPPKVQAKLGLTKDELKKLNSKLSIIHMGSYKGAKKGMHDLNAMAETGLLKLYTKNNEYKNNPLNPPFLPIAGITYGHKLATDLLAAIIKSHKNNEITEVKSFLYDATEEILAPFWPKEDQGEYSFLHNGKYPCYGLYATKDNNYVALAAVEEKYWNEFCRVFECDINAQDRFETKDQLVKKTIANIFLKHTKDEIAALTKDADLCLSLI